MGLLCLAPFKAVDHDFAVDHLKFGSLHPIIVRRFNYGQLCFGEFVIENVLRNSERCAHLIKVSKIGTAVANAWRCKSVQSKLATILRIQPGQRAVNGSFGEKNNIARLKIGAVDVLVELG